MSAASTRQIIVADADPTRLAWLVEALRDAGHAVFPVSDGEAVLSLAHMLSHADVLIASKETPTASGEPLDQLIQNRLPHVGLVYWDPNEGTSPAEMAQLLSH